eukprot:scaffold203922_cov27-Prasinocladus_malaysianus.AAC.1
MTSIPKQLTSDAVNSTAYYGCRRGHSVSFLQEIHRCKLTQIAIRAYYDCAGKRGIWRPYNKKCTINK